MEKILYDKNFYKMIRDTSGISVEPVLKALKEHYHGEIHSAVDLGCGIGVWLKGIKEFFDKNARIRGYDGKYVERKDLVISEQEFIPWNLQNKVVDSEKYDIAISLEVAEHLPKDSADILIDSLVELSDLVLFSAALPNQDGIGHVNERPLHYWIKKFNERNYEFYDIIRPCVWDNKKVSFWYKQNTVIFVKRNSESILLIDDRKEKIIDIVHPELLQRKVNVRVFKEYDFLWDCYKRIGIIRDLFDSFPEQGIILRMGGYHTKKLLSLIGKQNRKKIEAIIDCNPNCICKDEGYPIMQLDEIIKWNNINIIILSSFKERHMLLDESRLYSNKFKVIDLYQYLEKNGFFCSKQFFEVN